MVNKISFSISIVLLFFAIACENGNSIKKKNTTIVDDSGSFGEDTVLNECDCDSLTKDTLDQYFFDNQLYTGRCISLYPKTQTKYIEKTFLEGKIHGFIIIYDKGGNIISKEQYKQEKNKDKEKKNTPINCHCDSLTTKKMSFGDYNITLFDNRPFTGKCFKNYEGTDQKYLETEYKDGLPDGKMIIYDKNGNTITKEVYKKGEMIERK